MDTTPLLPTTKRPPPPKRAPRYLFVVFFAVLCATWFTRQFHAFATNNTLPWTVTCAKPQPISGAFAFSPTEFGSVIVTVSSALDGGILEKSVEIGVVPGTSDVAHVAFELRSIAEAAQIDSLVTALVSGGVLYIGVVLDDARVGRGKKGAPLEAAVRITLPQPQLASFVLASSSPSVSTSMLWDTSMAITDTLSATSESTSQKGSLSILTAPSSLSSLTLSSKHASIIVSAPLTASKISLSTTAGNIVTTSLSALSHASITTKSGSLRSLFHSTPSLAVSTTSGPVSLDLNHSNLSNQNIPHSTLVNTTSGHVKIDIVDFHGKFVAVAEEGVTKVSGKFVKKLNQSGWVGRESGKGSLEARSGKGNVNLSFL
ncbi:hypothetical protein HDU79_000162 [Rhizoclosmatium sp. JEL0117]|nr:hypothetical protein HDU79_000162 [Rhizoclosmatium sp. JEL0117]